MNFTDFLSIRKLFPIAIIIHQRKQKMFDQFKIEMTFCFCLKVVEDHQIITNWKQNKKSDSNKQIIQFIESFCDFCRFLVLCEVERKKKKGFILEKNGFHFNSFTHTHTHTWTNTDEENIHSFHENKNIVSNIVWI